MEVNSCVITDVRKGLNADKRLSVIVTIKTFNKEYKKEFLYTDTEDIIKFVRVCRYCGSRDEKEIIGKKIRIITQKGVLKGIGHYEFNAFFPLFKREFMEISIKEFEELLKAE